MTLERNIQQFNQQIKRAELIGKNKIIMAQCTNLTRSSDDWKLYYRSFPYGEGLFVLLVVLYRLKIQLRKPNRKKKCETNQGFPKEDDAPVEYFNELMCLHEVLE